MKLQTVVVACVDLFTRRRKRDAANDMLIDKLEKELDRLSDVEQEAAQLRLHNAELNRLLFKLTREHDIMREKYSILQATAGATVFIGIATNDENQDS